MQNYMKTIMSALKAWTKGKIKDSTADWNQNDASADNYVKNRTHWEEEAEKVIVEEQTIEGFAVMQDPIYAVQNAFSMTPVIGKTYTVAWDGVSYDVVAQKIEGMPCIGNENYFYMQSGGDIPFAIIFGDGIFVTTESTAESHTISISTPAIVHKIDEKYLPEMIATPDWNQNDPEAKDYIENRPFYEEVGYITYIEEQTVTLTANSKATSCEVSIDNVDMSCDYLPYRVTFDGVEYEGTMLDNGDNAWIPITLEGGETMLIYQYGYVYINSASLAGDHTIKVEQIGSNITLLPEKYLPDTIARTADVDNKMDKQSPTGIGPFSMNRKSGTTVGACSHTEGYNATASGSYSHAEGNNTTALSRSQHVSGEYNISYVYAPKQTVTTSNMTLGDKSNIYWAAEYTFDYNTGTYTLVDGKTLSTTIDAEYNIRKYGIVGGTSGTTMYHRTAGMYNPVETTNWCLYKGATEYTAVDSKDNIGGFLTIVGNGTSDTARSNAYTLDWNGTGWFAGGVKVGGTSQDDGFKNVLLDGDAIPTPTTAEVGQILSVKAVDENGVPTKWEVVDPMVITSSTEGSTKQFKITVDDSGTLTATEVVETTTE